MISGLGQLGRERALALFADWTDRIAKGEVPPAPPRPQGLERNVVITQWDWADPKAYLHDSVSTDRRNPSVNANGLLYGALELSADYLPVLDPVRHTASQVPLTVRDPNTPPTPPAMMQPSPYWGSDVIWTSKNNVHNPMFDERGRVWITSAVRPFENPAFCKEGSSHPSAKLFPIQRSSRHLAVYDPKTKKLTHISTCFGTHHLMFAEDANNTLWTSGGGQVVGWLNTKMFEETGDEEKSQGWTALIIDTNGNGKRDAYVEPNSRSIPPRTSDTARRSTRSPRRRTARSGVPSSDSLAPSSASTPARTRRRRRSRKSTSRRSTMQKAADSGILAARRGRRQKRRVLVRARERTPGQLRPPQVQGTAQRPDGHRSALPRGLDALRRAAAATQGRDRQRKRRGQLLHLGRSVRHVRAGREHADRHRQRVRRSAGAEGRQVGRAPRARIRPASTRNGWTAGSTIPRAAGRAGGSGRPSARARRSTWRPARARRAR